MLKVMVQLYAKYQISLH